MTIKYFCEFCIYETNKLCNYNKHLKSIKHNKIITKNNVNQSVGYDWKIDKIKTEYENKLEIEKLKLEKELINKEIENIRLEERLKSTETINEFLIKDKQHNEFIQKENAQIIKTGMNALSFVRTQFYNAPPIHYYKKANNLFDHKKILKAKLLLIISKRKNSSNILAMK